MALSKLTMAERKLLDETRQLWRDEDRTDAHRTVYELRERALADAIAETGFPVRMTAMDWDFRDDELEIWNVFTLISRNQKPTNAS
jgi:hypothetical protein